MALRAADRGSATILVVDDDEVGMSEFAEILRALGHTAITAANWTEAVRQFGDHVDLVFMDAVMPDVDGFKLTRILRERSRGYTPILFLTALGDVAAKERGMRAGADDFLSKPPDPVELRVRMSAMLRIRRLTQELEAERQTYERLAHIDELTGVSNRRSYDARVPTELSLSLSSGRPLSLLLIDIDHFKAVNDGFGHQVGDEVLGVLGALLRDELRRYDWAFRLGGEEFAVLTRDTNTAQARVVAERIRSMFEERCQQTAAGRRTCSIGIASADAQLNTPEELFARADQRLYAAKHRGRNCVVSGGGPDQ